MMFAARSGRRSASGRSHVHQRAVAVEAGAGHERGLGEPAGALDDAGEALILALEGVGAAVADLSLNGDGALEHQVGERPDEHAVWLEDHIAG
jgi:hypothetical protein